MQFNNITKVLWLENLKSNFPESWSSRYPFYLFCLYFHFHGQKSLLLWRGDTIRGSLDLNLGYHSRYHQIWDVHSLLWVDHKILIIQQKCSSSANTILVSEYINVVGDALTMGCAAETKFMNMISIYRGTRNTACNACI